MADDPRALHLGADHEAGHVGEVHERDIVGVAQPDEARRLVGGVDHQHATLDLGLVRHDADGPSSDPGQTHDDLSREEPLDLEERARVDHAVDHLVHVEPLALVVGHDVLDGAAGLRRHT
jgi:hypothetical protein